MERTTWANSPPSWPATATNSRHGWRPPPGGRAARWCCCRRSSGSTAIFAPSPRISPPQGYRSSRRACSTAYAAASSSATRRPKCRKAPATAPQLKPENTMKDLAAAAAVVRNSGRTATVGYCWGGTLSYLAACQLPVSLRGRLLRRAASAPRAAAALPGPVPLRDRGPEHSSQRRGGGSRRRIRTSVVNLYEGAGHGFNCDQRESYDPQAAALARTRTLEFLGRYLAGTTPRRIEQPS